MQTQLIRKFCIIFLLFLAGCSVNTPKNPDLTTSNQQEQLAPKAIELLPLPTAPPIKDCNYDINAYFEELQQWEMGFGHFLRWIKSNVVGGSRSSSAKSIEAKLKNFVNQTASQKGKVRLLRMEINPQIVRDKRAFEVEWYLNRALELTVLPLNQDKVIFQTNSNIRFFEEYCDIKS